MATNFRKIAETKQIKIFTENKKDCPWRIKGDHFYQCKGSGLGRFTDHCTYKNCPVMFWTLTLKDRCWL